MFSLHQLYSAHVMNTILFDLDLEALVWTGHIGGALQPYTMLLGSTLFWPDCCCSLRHSYVSDVREMCMNEGQAGVCVCYSEVRVRGGVWGDFLRLNSEGQVAQSCVFHVSLSI